MNAVATVASVLQQEIGLDPETIGGRSYEVAIDRRLAALKLATREDYADYLKLHPGEVERLVEEVIVPETWFFRDAGAYQELARRATTCWQNRSRVRCLSVPCSTGEEPYSIAITLLEAGLNTACLQIDAIDVSRSSLTKGASGCYSKHSFRGKRRECQYLSVDGETIVVSDMVRRLISFSQGNCVRSDFLQGRTPYDVIFCRNLLIYLDLESRLRVVRTLTGALASDGCLFVGHAEGSLVPRDVYQPLGSPAAFAFERYEKKVLLPKPEKALAPRSRSRYLPKFQSQASQKPAEPAVHADEGKARGVLETAAKLADRGALEQAEAICLKHLVDTGPTAAAYYLLGVIKRSAGDAAVAEGYFHRALYLESDCYEALVQLALIREQKGDLAGAANFRRRAERALKTTEAS